MTTLPVLAGYSSAVAYWINNSGEIVGTSFSLVNNNMDRATRFVVGSAAIDLGAPPGLPDSAAYAVNDNGLIVGGAAPLAECCLRFSAVTTFDGAGNASVWQQTGGDAYAVNNAGSFVGACCIFDFPGENTDAFEAPPLTTLIGGDSSVATSINNKGDVVDYFFGGSASGAVADSFVVYANGITKEIDAPGIATGPGSLRALAINDNDFIVGTYDTQYFSGDHAFVYLDKIVDLNTLLPANSGWTLQSASSVNIWGQIVGAGSLNGTAHGFLLTPSR